jgi:hypothetical protein
MATTTIGDTSAYSAVLFDDTPSSQLPDSVAEYAWYLRGTVRFSFQNQISADMSVGAFQRAGFPMGKVSMVWQISGIRLTPAQYDNVIKALGYWISNDVDNDAVGRLYLYVYDGTDNAAVFGTWTDETATTQQRVRVKAFSAQLEGEQWINGKLILEWYSA